MFSLFGKSKRSHYILCGIIPVLFAIAFISCTNFAGSSGGGNTDTGTSGSHYSEIIFRGAVSQSGAVPSELAATAQEIAASSHDNLLSSAMPVFNLTDYEYFATAQATDGSTVNGTFANTASPLFEISLAAGKTWTVTCGIRHKTQVDPATGEKKIALSDSFDNDGNPLTASSPVITHTFYPTPVEGGNGELELSMSVDSSITKVVASCNASLWTEATGAEDKILDVSDSTATLDIDNITSGTYDVSLKFFQANDILAYSTVQTINVVNGMKTDKWVSDGSGVINSTTGAFEVTSVIISGFFDTTIYVGQNSAATSVGVMANDSNSGHAYSPLEHLQAAMNKIGAAGDSTKDYKIFVSGSVTGTATGNTQLAASLNTKAHSITIENISGSTNATLQGSGSGSVLTVDTTVPLTLKNITVTGGNAADGGGICMESGSKVTLASGTVIGKDVQALAGSGVNEHGNYASGRGGGIYVHNATLILKNGSKVCNNYVNSAANVHASGGGGISLYGGSLTIENGAVISWNNSANGRGGGILIPDGDENNASILTMKGGEISHNVAGWYGGGVMIGHTGSIVGSNYPAKTFNFSGGTISENSISQEATYAPLSGGAGIFLDGGAFTMSGNAVIEKNEAILSGVTTGGGGIAISASAETTGSFTMTGGIIRNNSASLGGAVYFDDPGTGTEKSYSISGSASIPYGVNGSLESGKNDVYIRNSCTLEIAGALNSSFSDVGISTSNWARGTTILKLASGVSVTESFVEKFKCSVPSDDWEKIISSTKVTVNCPFYVGSFEGVAGSDSNNGSPSSPFRTIAQACSLMDNSDTDYIIKIIGSTDAVQQEIPSSLTNDTTSGEYHAKSILITGYGTGAAINRGIRGNSSSTETANSSGSALVVSSAVPVTIENVKITGGSSTNGGGGIHLGTGSLVRLGDGVQITENTTTGDNDPGGGGVFVDTGATLFMYGQSLIGDNTETPASFDDNNANYSNQKGGGIYNKGSVYIGYSGFESNGTTLVPCAIENGYGIRRNGSNLDGGSIYNTGTLKIASGNISYNHGRNGGGIYSYDGSIEISGGEIAKNSATQNGSALAYNDGSVYLKGTVSIPSGTGTSTSPLNDVWVKNGKQVSLDSTFALADTSKKIKLTPQTASGASFKKRNVLTGSISDTNFDKFDLNAPGFKLTSTTASGTNYGTLALKNIITDIYVASTGTGDARTGAAGSNPSGNAIKDTTWNNATYAYNEYSDNSAKPFASIEKALQFITYQESASNYNIYIDGTLTGAHSIANNTDTDNPINLSSTTATKVTLCGKNSLDSNGDPQDILNGGFSASVEKGRPLTINTNIPVDILRLGITGGYTATSGTGGGISIQSSSTNTVTLGDGTAANGPKIYGNHACQGGGIYKSAANLSLVIKNGTRICGNYADLGSSNKNGGGVYNESGTLTMTGGEISGNHAGTNGGGVYNSSTFYMSGGNICGNQASNGGGVYNTSEIYMSGTAIIGKTDATTTVSSDTAGANKATSCGGGIFNYGSAQAYIGYTSASSSADLSGGIIGNYAGSYGGGIYFDSNPLKVAAGKISFNRAGNSGGGIYTESMDITLDGSNYSIEMTDNVAGGWGGAIRFIPNNKNINIKGDVLITNGGSGNNNDISLISSSKITVTGALGGTGIIASITPSSYAETVQVLTIAASPSPTTTLAEASEKFAIIPNGTTPWYLGFNGYLSQAAMPSRVSTLDSAPSSGTVAACTQSDFDTISTWVSSSSDGLSGLTVKLYDDVTLDSTYSGIGTVSKPFKGTLDGQSKTVTLGSSEAPATCGLIIQAENAEIKNLVLAGYISSSYDCGAVAEKIKGSTTISNCISNCDITIGGSSRHAGGIVGVAESTKNGDNYSRDCIISDCVNNGNVNSGTGSNYTGGIVGQAYSCKIINCEQHGNVSGTWYVAGILGSSNGTPEGESISSYIENCCVTGNIIGTGTNASNEYLGGIFGSSTTSCVLGLNCCFSGDISGIGKHGGMVGLWGSAMNCENCYYVGDENLGSAGSGSISSGVEKIDSVTSTQLLELNAPITNLDTYSGISSYSQYRQWQLVSGKPKLVRN